MGLRKGPDAARFAELHPEPSNRRNLAPITLFVYNGMEQTLRAVNSLQENDFASRTVIQLILPGQLEPRARQDGQNMETSLDLRLVSEKRGVEQCL